MRRLSASLLVLAAAIGTTAAAHADGDAAHGKALFSRCSTCHAVTDQNKAGPHLSGVFGRKAGTVEGFRYSKALPASGIVWDDQTLDSYLADPAKAVAGTSMLVKLPKPEDRADIVAYLKTLTTP
ncbi:cytochrome C protein [Hypericibacter adhaerens]|uniref:Cytochrome C protein n=1 Tax=Hypericibacter adhaerens TaxID=2602016 RepID=A0A5J6N0Y5_9PROT|nr:c-type cytochrome [Hypericibacter adhaerens]QEX22615.1 cytochrome C protein [Hypericibacter adhaerens]